MAPWWRYSSFFVLVNQLLWICSIVAKRSDKQCLKRLNNWEPIGQTMFEASQLLRAIRTNDAWAIPTVESYSNKRCLSHPNSRKLFEQTMLEPSQQLKAIRTNDAWATPTVESYSNKRCLSHPNSWKLFERTMSKSSQRLKAIRTNDIWAIPMIKSYSNKRCLSHPNSWKLFELGMLQILHWYCWACVFWFVGIGGGHKAPMETIHLKSLSCFCPTTIKEKSVNLLIISKLTLILAERGGFEPPKRFRRLHAFQACLFNHSSTFPYSCLWASAETVGKSKKIFRNSQPLPSAFLWEDEAPWWHGNSISMGLQNEKHI